LKKKRIKRSRNSKRDKLQKSLRKKKIKL